MKEDKKISSNLPYHLKSAFEFSLKLATMWTSSPAPQKEALQKLVFPEGYSITSKTVISNRKNKSGIFLFRKTDKGFRGKIKRTKWYNPLVEPIFELPAILLEN